jgi:hypothetical protein
MDDKDKKAKSAPSLAEQQAPAGGTSIFLFLGGLLAGVLITLSLSAHYNGNGFGNIGLHVPAIPAHASNDTVISASSGLTSGDTQKVAVAGTVIPPLVSAAPGMISYNNMMPWALCIAGLAWTVHRHPVCSAMEALCRQLPD